MQSTHQKTQGSQTQGGVEAIRAGFPHCGTTGNMQRQTRAACNADPVTRKHHLRKDTRVSNGLSTLRSRHAQEPALGQPVFSRGLGAEHMHQHLLHFQRDSWCSRGTTAHSRACPAHTHQQTPRAGTLQPPMQVQPWA